MGTIRHNVIVCTFWDIDRAKICHQKAQEIFGSYLSEITKPATNGYCAFLVPPDGSKEGWQESDDGDKRRAEFTTWLKETYDQHYCKWFEVSMHECEPPTFVL